MEKRKVGRPKVKINYDKLSAMVGLQATGEECSNELGIDYDTLNAALKRDGHVNFSEYFKKGSSKGKISLRRAQFRSALEGANVTMQIWLGKQYLGQTDKVIEEENTPQPVEIKVSVVDAAKH